jgi:phosphatidylglycerophosphate synthase
VRWIPNALTALRVALLPVFFLALSRVPAAPEGAGWSADRAWAAGLLLVIGVTDYLDGLAARRLDAASRLGSVADAVADRLVIVLPLAYFAFLTPPAFAPVGAWIPVWIVALDLMTGTAWLVARQQRGVTAPARHNLPGRVAAWFFFALLLWIVADLPGAGVTILAAVALGLTTVSSFLYAHRWWGGAVDLDARPHP